MRRKRILAAATLALIAAGLIGAAVATSAEAESR